MALKKLIVTNYNLHQVILLDDKNKVVKLKYQQKNDSINDIYLAKIVKYLPIINGYFVEFYNQQGEKSNGFVKGANMHNIYKCNINYDEVFLKINKKNRITVRKLNNFKIKD